MTWLQCCEIRPTLSHSEAEECCVLSDSLCCQSLLLTVTVVTELLFL